MKMLKFKSVEEAIETSSKNLIKILKNELKQYMKPIKLHNQEIQQVEETKELTKSYLKKLFDGIDDFKLYYNYKDIDLGFLYI